MGIWEILARTVVEQLANCLSSTSRSMCLVIQTFLILHILMNGGSINPIIYFFTASYFPRSILASLRVLNLCISKVSLSWTIFAFKKRSMVFIPLHSNCKIAIYFLKAQHSLQKPCLQAAIKYHSLEKNERNPGCPIFYSQHYKKEDSQQKIHTHH